MGNRLNTWGLGSGLLDFLHQSGNGSNSPNIGVNPFGSQVLCRVDGGYSESNVGTGAQSLIFIHQGYSERSACWGGVGGDSYSMAGGV